ncbi:MAG: hypothetical protein Q7T82_13250 [Armatimonadota bacterium]|nr:hypothetical protein [Armatimonadota bacterium]
MDKPLAVQRKIYMDNSGPSLFGITRMQKVVSPKGEVFTFLGVHEGIVHLEREDKKKGPPFVEIDSSDFRDYAKQR